MNDSWSMIVFRLTELPRRLQMRRRRQDRLSQRSGWLRARGRRRYDRHDSHNAQPARKLRFLRRIPASRTASTAPTL
ncbi:MAG: hypothetical protein ACIALR_06825 [Blastopirellula sp. JB062]